MEYILYLFIIIPYSFLHLLFVKLFLKIVAGIGRQFNGGKKDFLFMLSWLFYVAFILPPVFLMLHVRNSFNPDTKATLAEVICIVLMYGFFIFIGFYKLLKNKEILIEAGYIQK